MARVKIVEIPLDARCCSFLFCFQLFEILNATIDTTSDEIPSAATPNDITTTTASTSHAASDVSNASEPPPPPIVDVAGDAHDTKRRAHKRSNAVGSYEEQLNAKRIELLDLEIEHQRLLNQRTQFEVEIAALRLKNEREKMRQTFSCS